MHALATQIDIDAPPERVWEVLVDFAAYPDWNPFVLRLEGVLEVGARLSITLQQPGGKPMDFAPRVIRVEPGRGFAWLGKLVLPAVFDGRHQFDIQARGTRSKFLHTEDFRGLLVPFMKGMLERQTRAGFEAMNQALKIRCESSLASAPSSA